MSEDLNDILYDIDMQLYDEFNDKIATMNDHLGDVYSFRDIEEVEKAEKEKEIKLLRIAIIKQQKEIERLKELNLMQRKQLNDAFDRGWIHKNTIEAGIKEIKNKKGDPLIRGAKIRALQSLLKKGNDADVR